MSLHALAYCQRLFYLEEVEEIRLADERVYAGRELHAGLEAEGGDEWASLELRSEKLGLTGKVDCLKRRDGSYIPCEHKRGRCRREADGSAGAWPSDRVQVVAYARLLEETFGRSVAEGRVRYHADNVTVRVPVDEAARAEFEMALADASRLRASVERPPITENEKLCVRCALAPVCLPEEVRHQRDVSHDPVRLFPPDRDGATLHVLSPGASVGRGGDCFIVRPRDGPETRHAVHEIETVILHGFAQITSQAVRMCAEHGIGVHWLTGGGRHIASLVSDVGRVQRRIRQYRALSEEATCLRVRKEITAQTF